MTSNLWNVLTPSTKIDFYYKIDQQKKHLHNLKNAKSAISTFCKRTHKTKNNSELAFHQQSKQPSLNYCHSQRLKQKQLPNIASVNENHNKLGIIKTIKQHNINDNGSHECSFQHGNHSKQHNRVQRLIDQQNSRLFKRLQGMKPSPTISKTRLIKQYTNSNLRYRVNMQKTRYKNPDFTSEAQKLLKGQKIKFIKISSQNTQPESQKYKDQPKLNFR